MEKNEKKDKFKKKYAFIVCNELFKKKTGLIDLPQTKNDLASIKRTVAMMGIEQKRIVEGVDDGFAQLDSKWLDLRNEITARTKLLTRRIDVGGDGKNNWGILWSKIKGNAMKLVDASKQINAADLTSTK